MFARLTLWRGLTARCAGSRCIVRRTAHAGSHTARQLLPVAAARRVIPGGHEAVVDRLGDRAVLVTSRRVVPRIGRQPLLGVVDRAGVGARVGVLLAGLLDLLLLLPEHRRLALRLVAQTHGRGHVVTVAGLDGAGDDALGLTHFLLHLLKPLVDGADVAGQRVALDGSHAPRQLAVLVAQHLQLALCAFLGALLDFATLYAALAALALDLVVGVVLTGREAFVIAVIVVIGVVCRVDRGFCGRRALDDLELVFGIWCITHDRLLSAL